MWIVEAQTRQESEEEGTAWALLYQTSDSEPTSHGLVITVENLYPYTHYRLRLMAENIAGQSERSEPSSWFQTIQAAPTSAPEEVTVRAINETALRVRWTVSMQIWQIATSCVTVLFLGQGFETMENLHYSHWQPSSGMVKERAIPSCTGLLGRQSTKGRWLCRMKTPTVMSWQSCGSGPGTRCRLLPTIRLGKAHTAQWQQTQQGNLVSHQVVVWCVCTWAGGA